MIFMYLLGIIAGIASTAQVSINGKVREVLRSPYHAAVLSFVVAGIIMSAIILVTEGRLYIPLHSIASQPLWIWLGGSCGTAIIILNVVCLPKLGSARNVMIVCFGQVMSGLVIDQFGMFGSPVVSMTFTRTFGALIVLLGVALVNGIKLPGRSDGTVDMDEPVSSVSLYLVLALLDGFACAAQIAINGTLNKYAGSAAKATLVSMTVGLITTLTVIALISLVRGRRYVFDGGRTVPWTRMLRPWMVFGGVMSVVVVGGNAVVAPAAGAGIVTVLNLIGMMGMALYVDAIGFLGIDRKPVTVSKFAGMILMAAGTAVISLV